MNFQKIWNWYSREKVQGALLEISKNREVVCVFKDQSFGKRPDLLQYPGDILQAVAEGAVAFHGSVERWSNPMKLDVSLSKRELDELRIGWDLILDPDVRDFEIGKIVTKVLLDALKDHGVKNYSLKFTGGKGFHIGIPFESFPQKINFRETRTQYPELFEKVVEYLKSYVKDQLVEELLALDNPINIANRVGKSLSEIVTPEGLDPFKAICLDVFSSRHLFRLPYSLHEKTFLVSLPLNPKKLEKFEREDAEPEKVKVEEKFLFQKQKAKDAEILLIEALDWASKHKAKVKVAEEFKVQKPAKIKKIDEKFFPPCIKRILSGLEDGRKRSVFILATFLKNMGWSNEDIEKKIFEWNEKNLPPLRASFLRTQLRWHFRQERNLLPPNCDNQTFYPDFGVCEPDNLCKDGSGEVSIKNPVNYPFRVLGRRKRKRTT